MPSSWINLESAIIEENEAKFDASADIIKFASELNEK